MARQNGLSDEQVAQLRADLAGGSFPRVQFVGTQPGASAGTVRRVGDPSTDGEDFVVVRVKINGVTDDLRFAPQELRRGSASATATASAPAKKAAKAAKKTATRAPTKSTAKATAPAKKAAGAPATSPAVKAPARRAPANKASAPATPVKSAARTANTKAAERAAAPAPAAKRKPVRRAGYGPSVTITLRSAEASWTVSAQRGARSVVKSAPVNPGIVSAIAELLDVPVITETIAGVNDIALADAESRAEVLRAELEQIQAVLDTHRRP